MREIPKDIIEKAAIGDMNAFEEIYKAFSSIVYNVAFNITHDRLDAEEAAQDVFVKVFRKLKDFKFESSFGTWIYRIAVNTAITIYRSKAKHKQNVESFDEYPDLSVIKAPDRTKDELEKESAKVKVAVMLEHLTPEHRSCIVLREIEGLDYQEMAQILQIPINTVRSRLKRAREALVACCGKREACHGL